MLTMEIAHDNLPTHPQSSTYAYDVLLDILDSK